MESQEVKADQPQTQTLLSSLHPSPSNPIYLIPHTILASSPHRNRITPLLQLGAKGFHVIHIVLSSSTEVNVARLMQSESRSRRGSAGSTATTATSGSASGFAGREAANDNGAGAGAGAKEGEIGNVLGRGTGVVDEASLLELRMEDEVLRLMSGIIGRRASASSASGASAASGASGKVGCSSNGTTTSANARSNSTIEGLEHHLSAEYEIDTSRLDAALTGMMAAEYVMDVMRRDGVLLGGAGRKRSC